MTKPLTLFGLPDNSFVKSIMDFRQPLVKEGQIDLDQSATLPHLTLVVTKNFPEDGDPLSLVPFVAGFVDTLPPFSLSVTSLTVTDDSVAAVIDNADSFLLATKLKSLLDKLTLAGHPVVFEAVNTTFMKLVRKVKPSSQENVKQSLIPLVPPVITIDFLCLAGHLLGQEDILWTKPLQ